MKNKKKERHGENPEAGDKNAEGAKRTPYFLFLFKPAFQLEEESLLSF
ncbi:MAG: hypothetical protein ACHQNT_02110 [Bacteroidia bacterium]